MEILNKVLDLLTPQELHRFGYTSIKYEWPIKPKKDERPRFWENNVSHVGIFQNAVDFIIPHPIEGYRLPIYMPADGTVIEIIQKHSRYGSDKNFAIFTNHIVCSTINGETFRIAHIAKDSCPFVAGQQIKIGTQIAETGTNGWMTDARHSHFEVGIVQRGEYKTLKIRWAGN